MVDAPTNGRVFLVGAGPGDAGLLTLRGAECLRLADVVIYDQLVSPRLLEHAPQAEHICVAELPGPHAERHPHVHQMLIENVRRGRTVVRLKGGDPCIFGRGGEEAEALRQAGIGYEIVPGVTAATAAAACAGIPLTHRDYSSAVAFVTGHECPGKTGATLDWPALARFPGTLVIYMGIARLAAIARTLIENGKAATTPAAVVHWASTGRQKTVQATLETIAEDTKRAAAKAPAVVIIGSVVELRRELSWFEQRPLFGRNVLVTRPRHQADAMIRRLENLGASVHSWPAVEIGPAPDMAAMDEAIRKLAGYQWLVFTSANGVHAFLKRLMEMERDLRALGHLRLAAIGSRTAEALLSYHLKADIVPAAFRSEELAASLVAQVRGQKVLIARADRGRELLREELARAADVDQIAVYSQADVLTPNAEATELLRRGQMHFVTLSSSNIARSFVHLLDEDCRSRLGKETKLVTISPVTSETVRELGYEVAAEAVEFTADGMIDALIALNSRTDFQSVHRRTD